MLQYYYLHKVSNNSLKIKKWKFKIITFLRSIRVDVTLFIETSSYTLHFVAFITTEYNDKDESHRLQVPYYSL